MTPWVTHCSVVPSQPTENLCITFVQRRPNVFGPTLYKYNTNVLCLLGYPFLILDEVLRCTLLTCEMQFIICPGNDNAHQSIICCRFHYGAPRCMTKPLKIVTGVPTWSILCVVHGRNRITHRRRPE